ncbi:MAG: hypothetical protein NVSMB62_20130 [Acidobacteriaceae bacterium]
MGLPQPELRSRHEIDELVDVEAGGEAVRVLLCFVLRDAKFQIGGDSDIELPEAVGEDVT